MANSYDIGDLVRVSVVFEDINGNVADPTAVSLKYRSPDGTVTTWAVQAGQIVKDSTGNYHADISATAAGFWAYRFIGTGAVQAAEEKTFVVKATLVT